MPSPSVVMPVHDERAEDLSSAVSALELTARGLTWQRGLVVAIRGRFGA